jgi:hypothetical protein
MMKKSNKILSIAILIKLILTASAAMCQSQGEGWFIAGSYPNEYEMGVTTKIRHSDKPCAFIKSKHVKLHGYGTYDQASQPGEYLGKSIRMTAWIESKNITGMSWAGMWFRVDGDSGKLLSTDNMYNRPIKGTEKWKKYEIILDVPSNAKEMAYGVWLTGSGEVYFTDMNFEVLGPATGKTGMSGLRSKPENLDFEK